MGKAMEVVSGFATNPGATPTVVTNATGDTTAIRAHDDNRPAFLLNAWGLGAAAGIIRVRSPRMHDNVNGLTMNAPASEPVPLLAKYAKEMLYSQDVLTVERTGGGAEVDTTTLLDYYTDLPGGDARLYRWLEIKPRIRHLLDVPVSVTSSATDGEYGGAVAINALADQFKANQDYAILGYITAREFATIGVRSPDFANLRVGGPGSAAPIETRDWFVNLAEENELPCIPVFNAANKQSTIVDVVDVGGPNTAQITFMMALLTT